MSRQKTGIATLTTAQALALFRDPQYDQGTIVFVDARDDRHYGAGHVPGAYQLDRYHPQNHLPTDHHQLRQHTGGCETCPGNEGHDGIWTSVTLLSASSSGVACLPRRPLLPPGRAPF